LISGVLFDLDGTLLDCIEPLARSFTRSLENFGSTVTDEGRQNVGGHVSKIISTRSRFFGLVSLWRLMGYLGVPLLKRPLLIILSVNELKVIASSCNTFNGVLQVLDTLSGKGIKMGVVTTRSRKETVKILRRLSMEKYFQVVVTRDDVHRGKPYPDPVLLAVKKLAIVPAEAIMVGDMPTDIQAGKLAGTKTAGITESLFRKELIDSKPDYLLASITEFPQLLDVL